MPSSIFSSERLTAADRPGVAQPVPERPVPAQPWGRIWLGVILLAALLLGIWEWQWRSFGAQPSYDDDEALWAIQRRRIDDGEGNATVLTGASRTFFDVQLPVWERMSGHRPIQLALDGTSPLFVVEDLADDPSFTGRLLIGVAPDVFFSGFEYQGNRLKYLHHESPSQRVGKWLSMHFVEPWFAFYSPDFALAPVLRRLDWLVRPGKHMRLPVRRLETTDADRNNYMWSKVVDDAAYRTMARAVWAQDFDDVPHGPQEIADAHKDRDKQIERATRAVAKLRARGVPVLFVREPSAGDYLAYETKAFPRAENWDLLMSKVGVPGIYYADYAELRDGYVLPDWSHLSKSSAARYTAALYRIVDRDYGAASDVKW